jgi:hypothetical protein
MYYLLLLPGNLPGESHHLDMKQASISDKCLTVYPWMKFASYPQGPDARTVVDAVTKNVVILGFFTPETTRETMVHGMTDAVEVLLKAAKGEGRGIMFLPS